MVDEIPLIYVPHGYVVQILNVCMIYMYTFTHSPHIHMMKDKTIYWIAFIVHVKPSGVRCSFKFSLQFLSLQIMFPPHPTWFVRQATIVQFHRQLAHYCKKTSFSWNSKQVWNTTISTFAWALLCLHQSKVQTGKKVSYRWKKILLFL